MKIYDMFKNQFAVYYCDNGCFVQDISRDETDFRAIEYRQTITMDSLKKMQEDDDCSVYEVIASHSGCADQIDSVKEYTAKTEDGEEFIIYTVDTWD